MTKTTLLMWIGMVCLAAPTADAQTVGAADTKYFVDVNVGGQFLHHDVSDTKSFALYDETATITAAQRTSNGLFFDVGVGYRFTPSLAGAIGFSSFSSSATATVTASIPHPLFFDQPLTVNTTAADMARTERDVHLRLVWFTPINEKIDLAVSAGPSIVKISQDLPFGTVAPGTQNLTVTASTESKTAPGFNLGADATYLVTPNIGVALVIHYVYASGDLPSASGVKAGGVQAGLGLHYRF